VLLALSVLLLAPLLLNVAAMRAEWQVSQLQTREDDLAAERSSLRAKVAALSSTQRIAEQATSLGLAPADPVDYLFLDQASPSLASGGDAASLDSTTAGG
jgi:cell division protein FtsL